MVKEVIESIKEAEAKAAGIIEEARKKRGEIVAGERDRARRAVEEADKAGKEEVRVALERAQRDAEARIEGIASDENKKRKAVGDVAAKNIPRAVEAVIERMLE
jgi:vacuolar-type H+-ATPase subunit H